MPRRPVQQKETVEDLYDVDSYDPVKSSIFDLTNHHVDTLDQISVSLKDTSNVQEWVVKNRRINNKQFSYDLATSKMMLGKKDIKPSIFPRPYLRKPLSDRTASKVYLKCRQSEITESEINDNYFLCATHQNFYISHLFPTAGMANEIAKQKINKAGMESPYIKSMILPPYNITSKFIGSSYYSVLGSWNDFGGRGPSSDKITYDEYDFHNPRIKQIFAESMSHSEYQYEVFLSTPTVPGGLISKEYEASSQFKWKTKCQCCKKWQEFKFPDNIINFFERGEIDIDSKKYYDALDRVYIGCRYCKKPLDKTSDWYVKNSVWVPKKKFMIDIKNGYHITYFMLPWKTGKEILHKYHSFDYVEQFWNEICGVSFLSEDDRLTKEIFDKITNYELKSTVQNINLLDSVSVGVDWGKTESWCVVGGSDSSGIFKVVYIEKINNKSLIANGLRPREESHQLRVEQIANQFDANILVNDANGLGTDKSSELNDKFHRRSFAAFYDTKVNRKQLIGAAITKSKVVAPQWNENEQIVTINRVMAFKQILSIIKTGKIEIPAREPLLDLFIDHIKACNIITRKDEHSRKEYQIMVSTGPDHFAHALLYSYNGWRKIMGKSGNPVGIIDSVI